MRHWGAGVAQLVERHVANVVVVGSNPISRFARSRPPVLSVEYFPIVNQDGIRGL